MANLKDVLGDELFAQVDAKINERNAGEADKTKHVRFVDLSEGGYVSKNKYDDKIGELSGQVTDLQGQIAQRDTDMEDLNAKLSAAQNALTELQSKYNTDRQNWEEKISQQAYEYRVRERANGLQFSSNAARSEFIRSAIAKKFQTEGDTLLGFDDYVTAYKEKDPGAFVAVREDSENPENNKKPDIVRGSTQGQTLPEKSVFGFHFSGVRAKPKE